MGGGREARKERFILENANIKIARTERACSFHISTHPELLYLYNKTSASYLKKIRIRVFCQSGNRKVVSLIRESLVSVCVGVVAS